MRRKWTKEELEKKVGLALELALNGISIDGDHHKQWHLVQIAMSLGMNAAEMEAELGDFDPGVAP